MIFTDNGRRLHAAGVSILPLIKGQKRPILNEWSRYCKERATEEELARWEKRYSDANIGGAMGPASDMMAVDLDSDDPRVKAIVEEVLPKTPWVRVGAKGAVYGYRWNGVDTFRIKGADGKTIVEVLGTGTQIVLPPSIHPTTLAPYYATADLVDVKHRLPELPKDVEERLRTALIAGGVQLSLGGYTKVLEYVPAGARDNKMVSFAGLLAMAVQRGECTFKEAVGRLATWHEDFVQKTPGDPIDLNKGINRLVTFLHRDVKSRGRQLPKGWDAEITDEERRAYGLDLSDDDVEWDHDRLRYFVLGELETPGVTEDQKVESVKRALVKVANSERLGTLDTDRLLNWFVQACPNSGLTKGGLKRQLAELKRGEVAGTSHHEIAEATLADMEEFGEIRFDQGGFWRWCGSHFEPLSPEKILAHITKNYGELPLGRRHSDHAGILKTVRLLAARRLRGSNAPDGVNFANGFLTTDLRLLPHHESFGMTYRLPYRWMPEEGDKAFRFREFLARAWEGDPDCGEKVEALRQAIAATLFSRAWVWPRAVVLYGAPATGKSELQKIVRHLMPEDSVCSIPPEDWDDRFKPAQMVGRLFNQCGELSENKFIDGEKFKTIVSGETINVQHKNQPVFMFEPRLAHWFASNHLPKSRDGSGGFTRRWLVLEFNRPVPPTGRVIDVGGKIAAEEREAIAAWAAPAILDLERQGDYTVPRSSAELMTQVGLGNNRVLEFLERGGKVEVGPGLRVEFEEILHCYRVWCLAQHQTPERPITFMHRMRALRGEKGFEVETRGERVFYSGIGLKEGALGRLGKAA